MVTALALQLIQCVVKLPEPETDDSPENDKNKSSNGSNSGEVL